MDLKEWTNIYLRQRDLYLKQNESIKETETGFIIMKKDGTRQEVRVQERLGDIDGNIITTLNTKENVEHLITSWKHYITKEGLLLIFVNPEKNEKWLIRPVLHHRISDGKSLAQGLQAMANAISLVP